MAHDVSPRYRDRAGAQHHVRVERSPGGCWRVLDVGPHGIELVEALTGPDDRRPQAVALACDYAAQQRLAARDRAHGDHGMARAA